jgi:hypothetical protein
MRNTHMGNTLNVINETDIFDGDTSVIQATPDRLVGRDTHNVERSIMQDLNET